MIFLVMFWVGVIALAVWFLNKLFPPAARTTRSPLAADRRGSANASPEQPSLDLASGESQATELEKTRGNLTKQ